MNQSRPLDTLLEKKQTAKRVCRGVKPFVLLSVSDEGAIQLHCVMEPWHSSKKSKVRLARTLGGAKTIFSWRDGEGRCRSWVEIRNLLWGGAWTKKIRK